MTEPITASMLYNYVQCPHRVTLDIFENPANRDPVSAFVQLLWERGSDFEQETIEKLDVPFENLRPTAVEENERLTSEAMQRGDELIYGGRIRFDNLLGEPDLIRKEGGRFVAGDIKSGAGFQGMTEDNAGKPKKHYAVQLALYTDILDKLGLSAGHSPFIWDIHGQELRYELDSPMGTRTPTSLWEYYKSCLHEVSSIATKNKTTLPALCAMCKLCHWHSLCLKQLKTSNDLSLIPELGRTRRDALSTHFKNVADLAGCNLADYIDDNRTVFQGIGRRMLETFHQRAILLSQPDAGPFLREDIHLPQAETVLFFDVETDPIRDICYLHGFVERRSQDPRTEKYVAFFADDPTRPSEHKAFADAWDYIQRQQPCIIYYYSPYERTTWRRLQNLYPEVMSGTDLDEMFSADTAVDLYLDVVRSKTEWPTNDYSIKTLATYLGFKWRDKEPSGAASIEWYHRWVDSGDADLRRRILDYNEDDCIAMRVLLDAVRVMPLRRHV
jgi:uncharacterized protein